MKRVQALRTIVLFVVLSQSFLSATPGLAGGNAYSKNLTGTDLRQEVNPRFTADGENVIYMEFTGDPDNPAPWDYRLLLTDRNGFGVKALTLPGVLDFQVLANGRDLLFVQMVLPPDGFGGFDTVGSRVVRQLKRLNLETQSEQIVETDAAQSLAAVYAAVGLELAGYFLHGDILSVSPAATNRVSIVNDPAGQSIRILQRAAGKPEADRTLLHSDLYLTQQDLPWRPSVIWLDEFSLISNNYESAAEDASAGRFAINRIDLRTGVTTLLYASGRVRPFPRLALNNTGSVVYFQQNGGNGVTELWGLNLTTGYADKIYETLAEPGTPRCSPDGASLVFTQLENQDFDIIRLDLERNRIRSLAAN